MLIFFRTRFSQWTPVKLKQLPSGAVQRLSVSCGYSWGFQATTIALWMDLPNRQLPCISCWLFVGKDLESEHLRANRVLMGLKSRSNKNADALLRQDPSECSVLG